MHSEKRSDACAPRQAIAGYRWHVLMCVGPDCCGKGTGKLAWKALKRAIKESGLRRSVVLRSKVDCLGLCRDGPLVVVYPGGTWYGRLTAERMPRFVREHLLAGCPVEDWIIARNPLAGSATSPEEA